MRKVEKYEMTTVHERVVEVTCDWCGADVPQQREQVFKLRSTWRESYGADGGSEAGWQVQDLCLACRNRLKDLLEESGVQVTPYEVDW